MDRTYNPCDECPYGIDKRDGSGNDSICKICEFTTLLNRRAAPENKPLTLEQLRQMDGEPVWIVIIGRDEINRHAGWGNAWKSKAETMNATQFTDDDLFMEDEYGKIWLAYTRKPEQEGKE